MSLPHTSFHTTASPLRAGTAVRLRFLTAVLGGLLLLAMLGFALALQQIVPGAATAARLDGEGIFHLTNVWRIHLTFAPDQWLALEPRNGAGRFGGPGGFGPGSELTPMFLDRGDTNHDGKLSREEFSALGLRWFGAWDTNQAGHLDLGKIRVGLAAAGQSAGGPQPAGGGNRNGFAYVQADLDFEDWRFRDVSVRYKGNNTYMSSRNSLKRPLKVDLNRGFNGRRLGGVTTLNLHNNINDPGGMNEPLSYRLFRDTGVPAGRTAYARLYFTVPGKYTNQYAGVYSIVENVDRDFMRSRFGTGRGTLFKPTGRQVFEDLGDRWSAYQRTYAARTPVLDHEANRVIAFSKLVSHASDAEFAARLEEFLDLDEFARFMAVTVWLSNMDSLLGMGQNFYVYLHPKTQQFLFLPWDFDHSFGQFPMAGSPDELERLSILKPWSGQVRFLERVFKVERFQRLYLARLKEFSGTLFRPARIQQQVDELAAVLRPGVSEESAQLLARFDEVVAGNAVVPGGFGGPPPGGTRTASLSPSQRGAHNTTRRNRNAAESPFGGPGSGAPPFGRPPGGFGAAMKPIKSFVVARAKSVNEQLAGKSAGVTLSRSGPGGPPGGPGGPREGPPERRGPGGFGPAMFLAQAFMTMLDADKDGRVAQAEFIQGFLKCFDSWNTDPSGVLTEAQLQAGINQDLLPSRRGPPPDDFGQADSPDDF